MPTVAVMFSVSKNLLRIEVDRARQIGRQSLILNERVDNILPLGEVRNAGKK